MNTENKVNLIFNINLFCEQNELVIGRLRADMTDAFSIIDALVRIDMEMVKRIEQEHKKNYVTDEVERTYAQFVYSCMGYIINEREADENFFLLLADQLFTCRHYGYAYFWYIDKNLARERLSQEMEYIMMKHAETYKMLYMSLLEFYTYFYGGFADNEYAICLICKYYQRKNHGGKFSDEEEEKIANAIIPHIKNAGTVGDLGYAYRGLEVLEKYIYRLAESNNIIQKILGKFTYNEVITIPVRRRQIYTIIFNISKPSETRPTLTVKYDKTYYLDSILIFDALKDTYNEAQQIRGKEQINFYKLYDMPITETNLALEDNAGNEYEISADIQKKTRKLQRKDGEVLFEVRFHGEVFACYGGREYEVKSDSDLDYTLSFYDRKFYLNLKNHFLNLKENHYIAYKLVYLNNYHGMQNKMFCFDKRFNYSNHIITFEEKENGYPKMAYSNKVDSIYAIVGRNGTGKSSIIDFLGKEFVNILSELEREGATIFNVCNSIEDIKNAEFLVVFQLNDIYYYLSNMRDIGVANSTIEISDYARNVSGIVKRTLSKIFYYSNKTDMSALFEKKKVQPEHKANKVQSWSIKNYSEQAVWQSRYDYEVEMSREVWNTKEDEKRGLRVFNNELFYQLIFLRCCVEQGDEFVRKLLWDTFSIDELMCGEEKDTNIVRAFIRGEEVVGELRKVLFENGTFLHHFSSGQYAKLNFLSRLYWITSGCSKNAKLLKLLGLESTFYSDDVIGEDESAILFIDEGDLYYHPEWQRSYINDLCKVLDMSSQDYKLQVLIATNSPFILSDMFKDAIVFLPENETKAEISQMKETFGQNIHTLLKKNFFMDYTIGEFVRKVIVQLFDALESEQYKTREKLANRISDILKTKVSAENVYEWLYDFSKRIGEQVYCDHLRELINEHINVNSSLEPNIRIEFLERRKQEIENELYVLRKRSEYHD